MIRLMRIFSVVLLVFSAALYTFSGIYVSRGSDAKGPEIYMEENELTVSIDADEEDLLKGITAEDNKDGDVTDSLMIEKVGMFTEKGKRKITIDAFDSNNNVTKTERVIVYSDYTSPRLSLTGPLRVAANATDEMLDVITVEDCLDGDITENLQITPVENITNITVPGDYDMKITVTNSAGDVVEMPVTVEVYDYSQEAAKPQILLTDYIVYTSVGSEIDPGAYLKGVQVHDTVYDWNSDSDGLPYSKSSVMIENPVDTKNPGTYEIAYSLENDGRISTVRLIVVVEE